MFRVANLPGGFGGLGVLGFRGVGFWGFGYIYIYIYRGCRGVGV